MNPRGTKKRCTKCKLPLPLKAFYYHRTRKHYVESCKKCNSKACMGYQTRKRAAKDPKFVFMMRAVGIKRSAQDKGIPVMEGLAEHLLRLWGRSKGKCYYTGRQMKIDGGYHRDVNAATVDRRNPKRGYVKGNIVLCVGIANRVKQNLSIAQLYALIDEMKRYKAGGK